MGVLQIHFVAVVDLKISSELFSENLLKVETLT